MLALGLFLFWGAFFVAHIKAWFIDPFPQSPPPKVWLIVALHGGLLAGLLAGWRWELAGALIVLFAGGTFFWLMAGTKLLGYFAITALPALAWLWSWAVSKPRFLIRLF